MNSVKKSFIIIVLGIALYSLSLFNGFVWDDEMMFNTQLTAAQAYFRPAMTVVNGTIVTLFGAQPFFFHLFSVVFHIATAVLLFYLFKRFFKESIAFFLSLIFLVHPASVEAVCFASALQEILFTFTGVLSLYLFVREKSISLIIIFGAIILSIMALLMKETGIVFFVLIFCYLLLFHRKNTNVIRLYIAFAIIALFTYGMARFSSGNNYVQGQGLFPIMRVPLHIRLINIPLIIVYYIGTFLFPFNLGIAQHWVIQTMDFWHFWVPLGIDLFFILTGVYLSFRRNKVTEKSSEQSERDSRFARFLPSKSEARNDNHQLNLTFLFFFLWFLIGLLPHLQLIPLNMTVAERWLYFPMIGILGMIGSLLDPRLPSFAQGYGLAKRGDDNTASFPRRRESRLLYTLLIIIICIFSVRSYIRVLDWRNGLSLYSSNITQTSSFDLQNNMGVELFRIGKYEQAKQYFEVSTRLAPYWWVNWNNLGAAYEQEKNFSKAQECYEKAIHNGQYVLAYENLARILMLHGKDKQKAKAFLKKALEIFPDDTNLRQIEIYYEQH